MRIARYARGFALAAWLAVAASGPAQSVNPNLFGGLSWRLVGPFRGGRALAISGAPGSPEKFYFGAVGGGVWESDNAGRTWKPIFDSVSTASIGALAVAPSNPNMIYVGTGEADMRGDIQQGDGMYKSVDGGRTWSHIGLEDTRQIGKVVIDPGNPDIVYVAALGHQYGPNEERGVFKTTDGGKTWTKVLYKNPNVGAIDLAMDPRDSGTLYASMWQTRRPPWSAYPPSNGPGSGLYKSTDGGATWTQIQDNGLPAFVGRIGLTIPASQPNRVYALVDTNDFKSGGMYRSDDGGASWTKTSGDHRIWMRGWYFAGITADPKNPDEVYVMNTSAYRSIDGGKTFIPFKGAPGGDDYHTFWVSPDDSDRMAVASDQGVVVSVDGGKSWSSWYNQPTGQFYHVITDNRFPYWIYGAQQDSGAMAMPSRSIHTGPSAMDWRPIDAGGESGTIAPDLLHPGVIYGSGGSKEELDDAWEQNVDPTLRWPDTQWRSEWTQPIAASEADKRVLYMGHQSVFRSDDGGASWSLISPDLTRSNIGALPNLDAATAADTTGLARRGVVYWIAPSPIRKHQIWVGTDDGLLWLTFDEGKHWKNVTPAGLSAWSKIGVVDASHHDPNVAYVAVDRHRLDDNRPYIYRTMDGGRHWRLVVNELPGNQFVNVVREDPINPHVLYAGTDWGVFVSLDQGAHWQSLQRNLPATSVRDIVFNGSDVIVGTHGRAIWVMDDAEPLRRALSASRRPATLFPPEPAMLFQRAGTFGFGAFDEGTPFPPEEPQGENPPWGAVFDYNLARPAKTVVLAVYDLHGNQIRRISSADRVESLKGREMDIPDYWVKPDQTLSAEAGSHRYIWDLRLRGPRGPIVPPGQYRVELRVDGHPVDQSLKVIQDPRVHATIADLKAQFHLALEVQDLADHLTAARDGLAAYLKKHAAHLESTKRTRLLALLGDSPEGTPDEGGNDPTDAGSLRALIGHVNDLSGAVQSAPAAPTKLYLATFALLQHKAKLALSELVALETIR